MKHEQRKKGLQHNKWALYFLLITALVMLLWEPSTKPFLQPSKITTSPANQMKPTTHNPTIPQCFEIPIPELLQAIVENDEEVELWGAAALAMRDEEAMPYIEATLQDGTPWEQYSLARTLKDANPERYIKTLLQLATNPKSHPQAQTGALYALSRVSLDNAGQQAIAAIARDAESTPLRRTALIALQHSSLSTIQGTLEAFLEDDDPITRIYATRLLLETNHALPADSFLALAKHQDYLVRQEAYMTLGEYNDTVITNFLQNAAATETNESAARAARLALNKQKIKAIQGVKNEEEALSLLLNTEDEQECWQGIQLALHYDEALGAKALKRLVSSNSELQETAVAQLIALQYTKDSIVPELQFPVNKHAITIHETLAHYNVTLHNDLLLPSVITPYMELLFTQADINEDFGIQPLTHAWNPLTGRGFLRQHGFGGSAQEYASRLLYELDNLCSNNDITLGDQKVGWQLAGRLFHLLQDMTSPLHVFNVWHVFHGHFETYWKPFSDEALVAVNAWNTSPLSLPDIPQAAVFHLDDHTCAALEQHITNLPNTLSAYQEALAWCTYYRASFWGEIRFAEQASSTYTLAATFDDKITEALPNVLDLMFDHNIRYHTSWLSDYFEITDRQGNTFTWNRMLALDDWRPCSNPQNKQLVDGHIYVSDDIPHITGRFYFTHKWKRTPYCFPHAYPDGTIMADHIVQYYGKHLFPVTVAYGGGWLLTLAQTCPSLFNSNIDAKNDVENLSLSENLTNTLRDMLSISNSSTEENPSDVTNIEDYLHLYLPRCGCIPQ